MKLVLAKKVSVEEKMTDQTEKRYEHELTIDDLDKIAGGWYDLPKNAPTNCNCPRCGTSCYPRKIEWGPSIDPNGPQNNDRVIGTYRCTNCSFEWEISNKIG